MTAKTLKHSFTSAISDGGDATLLRPSNWNAEHTLYFGYRTVSGASDTVAHADHMCLVTYTNSGAIAVGLPAPAGGNMPLGWQVRLRNHGLGTVTITGSGGGTINGGGTLVLASGETVDIHSIGTADYVAMVVYAPTSALFNTVNYGQINLTGQNSAGTPNTIMDFTADRVALANTSNKTIVKTALSASCNIGTAGPALNGRDQAGAFTASSWLHYYWIHNPTSNTTGTIASTAAPPTGPSTPSGYTHWCYIGAVRFNSSSHLVRVHIRGNKIFYDDEVESVILDGVQRTTQASADISLKIPTNALSYMISCYLSVTPTVDSYPYVLSLRVITGVDFNFIGLQSNPSYSVISNSAFELPNVGQNFFYAMTGDGVPIIYIYLLYYAVPNGAQ